MNNRFDSVKRRLGLIQDNMHEMDIGLVFVLAFFFKTVNGRGAFWGMILGEIAIFSAFFFTDISFLLYNVIGAVVVVVSGLLLSSTSRSNPPAANRRSA